MGTLISCATGNVYIPRCSRWSVEAEQEFGRYVMNAACKAPNRTLTEVVWCENPVGDPPEGLSVKGHTPMIRAILSDARTCKALKELRNE